MGAFLPSADVVAPALTRDSRDRSCDQSVYSDQSISSVFSYNTCNIVQINLCHMTCLFEMPISDLSTLRYCGSPFCDTAATFTTTILTVNAHETSQKI